MDTTGLLLDVVAHPADIQDRDGAKLVIGKLKGRFERMRLIWADAGYSGKLIEWVRSLRAGPVQSRLTEGKTFPVDRDNKPHLSFGGRSNGVYPS